MVEGKTTDEFLIEQVLLLAYLTPSTRVQAKKAVQALLNARKVANPAQKKQLGLRIRALEERWGTLRPGVPVVMPVRALKTYPAYAKWGESFLMFLHEAAKKLMMDGQCHHTPLVAYSMGKSGLIYRTSPTIETVRKWLTETRTAVWLGRGQYVPGALCKEFAEAQWVELGVKAAEE